ncbi:MAG: UDP-N-acetylglucosamine 2-epimerase (non-hydrolyzing) [Nanoarchaeota archaeon]
MKICICLGTRPEIIKMSSLIRLCAKHKEDYFIIHTGQHYSYSMDKIFFEELELPPARYNLEVGSASHAIMTARILERIEPILLSEKPDVVLVQGDTNTVLAAALTATKLNIKVGHVEAGLRSYDRSMPEETNRILTDHMSDYLFCPTKAAAQIARNEQISETKIHTVGNTIVDAVYANLEIARRKADALTKYNLTLGNYFLITAHRQENVDNKHKLTNILTAFGNLAQQYNIPVFYPIHPRARKMITTFNIPLPPGVILEEPCSFMEFLQLEEGAKLILTDSGGVQEEACILHIPCVTLRENTERPETINVGGNMLAGTDVNRILNAVEIMLSKQRTWPNPFGDGRAAQQIIHILKNKKS